MKLDETLTVVEPLVGWRGYTFARPQYLTTFGTVHEPRIRNEAVCEIKDHLAPDEQCSCRFYAFKRANQIFEQAYSNQDFLAEVWLWGKVVEHTDGYRAQYAYPKKLYAQSEKTKKYLEYIADVYGVPFSYTPLTAPATPSKLTTTIASRNLTFEEMWAIAFNDKIEASIRRYARQQVRQRVYMKARNAEQTEQNIRANLTRIVNKRRELALQMKVLDELKSQIK
jgi:hypothetical protein